jgi:HAE1 family hydrophobic/amphiphilic exporter-1
VREIQVRLDPDRLSALGVSATEVSTEVRRENRNVSAGDMQATGREVLIRSVGEYSSPAEIEEVVVANREESVFRSSRLSAPSASSEKPESERNRIPVSARVAVRGAPSNSPGV